MDRRHVIRQLSALGNDTRFAIFTLLRTESGQDLCAGEIAQSLGIRSSTLSAHLNRLHDSGLIVAERDGRHIRYRLAEGGLADLAGLLGAIGGQDAANPD